MEWKEGEPRFTGQPGPDLDANWDKLLASKSERLRPVAT